MKRVVEVPIALVHRRWSIPILGLLEDLGGARFAALRGHLGVSRDALTSTLAHLIALGLVQRNAEAGHPARPEYLATPAGLALAGPCAAIDARLVTLGARDVGLRKWSLPVVGVMNPGAQTFSALREQLPPITPRALSKTLDDLVGARVVEHADAGPYGLSRRGRTLIPPLQRLQRQLSRADGYAFDFPG